MTETTIYNDTDKTKPLSGPEEAALVHLEEIVRKDLRAFMRVGNALAEIKNRGLYRLHGTFREYCRQQFDLGKSHFNRLILAADVVENLKVSLPKQMSPTGGHLGDIIDLLPANERQVRPLLGLKPDQQRQVWRVVIDEADEKKKITGGLVAGVVKKYLGKESAKGVGKIKKKLAATTSVGTSLMNVFELFLAEIEVEAEKGFSQTDKKTVIRLLEQLRITIAGDGFSDRAYGDGADANKLERAGYNLVRMDKTAKAIKLRSGGGWPHYKGPFATIAEMEIAFAELLTDDMYLRG